MADQIERRPWQCPDCGRTFQIPAASQDPKFCPRCVGNHPDEEAAPIVNVAVNPESLNHGAKPQTHPAAAAGAWLATICSQDRLRQIGMNVAVSAVTALLVVSTTGRSPAAPAGESPPRPIKARPAIHQPQPAQPELASRKQAAADVRQAGLRGVDDDAHEGAGEAERANAEPAQAENQRQRRPPQARQIEAVAVAAQQPQQPQFQLPAATGPDLSEVKNLGRDLDGIRQNVADLAVALLDLRGVTIKNTALLFEGDKNTRAALVRHETLLSTGDQNTRAALATIEAALLEGDKNTKTVLFQIGVKLVALEQTIVQVNRYTAAVDGRLQIVESRLSR